MTAVRVETAAGVMTVTLVDVENRNALGAALVQGLYDAIASANDDPDVRAVVVTNEGSTFCAGANLKERSGAKQTGAATVGFEDLLRAIQTSPTPIIGRIAGHVVGGGNGLASALDISIASEDVKFGFTEVRLGVAPAIISVVCLPKMRAGEAMEAFLRGNRFPASKAAELGLINRAVPADQLDAAVEEVLAAAATQHQFRRNPQAVARNTGCRRTGRRPETGRVCRAASRPRAEGGRWCRDYSRLTRNFFLRHDPLSVEIRNGRCYSPGT